LFHLKSYTIREWIEYVEDIYFKSYDEVYGYFFGYTELKQRNKDTRNSQNPLDLLMAAWTERTTIVYAILALKNFGINMAKLLLRKSKTNGLNEFPAFKKVLEKWENVMAEYKTKYFK